MGEDFGIITKEVNTLYSYVILTLVLYLGSYLFYVVSSRGAGKKAIYLQMRRYIPCALAPVVPLALVGESITEPFYLACLLIAVLWIVTYPALYYITNHKVSMDFEFHFETPFGYYFVTWITSILILCHMLPKILALPMAVFVSTVEMIFFIIPVAQIVYYLLYKSCINENGMQMLQETHYNEIIEFFKAIPIQINLLSLVTIIGGFYGFFAVNYNYLLKGMPLSMMQFGMLTVLALYLTFYLWKGHRNRSVIIRTAIVEFYLDIKEYRETNKQYKNNTNKRMEKLEVKPLGKPFSKAHTMVLIIGESASRDYMKCFNPKCEYETTPWMDELVKSPNCVMVPHAYSNMANTVIAVSNAMTEMNQYNDKKFYESCSLVDVAHKLGYKVHWYSNQGHLGCADTPVSLIAETADVAKWTKKGLNKIQYDESLLDYFDEIDPTANNLLVVHLKGNHFNFLNRFPESFSRFSQPGKYDLIPNYADSIAYTDYVLEKIFNYAKEKLNMQSFVYFSDHATLPDRRRSPDFQGFGIVRIPLVIYFSDEYIAKNREVYDALRVNKDRYWTNDLAYELMCSVFNIESNHFDKANSLASKEYKYNKDTLLTNSGTISLKDDHSED